MPFFKTAKKYAKKATKAVGKRYGVSYGRKGLRMSKSSLSRIDKDVQMIKSRLNVEKKLKVGLVQTGTVAQANQNTYGFVTHDLTPLWTQGVGEDQRVGNSLKLTGFHMKLQLRGQQYTGTKRRLKIMLIKTTRPGTITLDNIVEDMFDINPLTGFVDYHSDRDYSDNQKTEKVLRTVYMTLGDKPYTDSFGDGEPYAQIADRTIALKLQDVLRFENNLTSAPNDARYFVVMLCDTGNKSTSSSSTNPGVMIQPQRTGVEYQFHNKFWYCDN